MGGFEMTSEEIQEIENLSSHYWHTHYKFAVQVTRHQWNELARLARIGINTELQAKKAAEVTVTPAEKYSDLIDR
jgi:hypothetical protein